MPVWWGFRRLIMWNEVILLIPDVASVSRHIIELFAIAFKRGD